MPKTEHHTSKAFAILGADEILKCGYTGFKGTFARRWMSAFAARPLVCSMIWDKLDPFNTMPRGVHMRHLLWAMYFMKVYPSEHTGRAAVAFPPLIVDEKTWRKWIHTFVVAISFLEAEVVRVRFAMLLQMNANLIIYFTSCFLIIRFCGMPDSRVTLETRP